MKKSNRLETYFRLFLFIVETPRIMPNKLAEKMRHVGRGRSPATIVFHLENMYTKGISFKPQMALKAYKSTQKTTYLCRRQASKGLYSLCKEIDLDRRITYSLCFSSRDFFLISTEEDLNVEKFGLSLEDKSKLFTPIYPIPKNWNLSVSESLKEFSKTPLVKKKIERIVFNDPEWTELDWNIFHVMKNNMREKFTEVARNAGGTSKTVKAHFYKKILPSCVTINYFFPKGFNYYNPVFIEMTTDFEMSLVKGLERLSCTTYVFPLEKSLVLILFHDPLSAPVSLIKILDKMEETAIINDYLLHTPIVYMR